MSDKTAKSGAPSGAPEYDASDPSSFFQSTAHELVAHDASYKLLQSADKIRDILSQTNIPDLDYLTRVSQCIAKLEECELGEEAEPPYDAPINFIKNILNGLPAIEGFSRSEFIQALGRLFAPSVWELKKTGSMSGSAKAGKRKYDVLKSREDKPEESEP